MTETIIIIAIALVAVVLIGFFLASTVAKLYVKVDQGSALIRNGLGGTKVAFTGLVIFPLVHQKEFLDISAKRIEIWRTGKDGLVCKDNMRADIKVAFFVRVNKSEQDVLRVAQSIGCRRASDPQALVEFFDAKFSEALKTVGKGFDFTELYTSREKFKHEILNIIGTDLNGFVLDDAAIDYLEQTAKETLNPDNILDAEGIKKITELTAQQVMLANKIDRDREKTIKQQDVEAREAILELDRQKAEAEARQKREIEAIQAREEAESLRIQQEERLKSEQARIRTLEEIQVAEENRERQVIVARKAKERTDKVETERVERDRALEENERQRIVTLAQIEKEKALEEERKTIQLVIRERVTVERDVVVEQERIKDTQAHATAEREKTVALTGASRHAEEELLKRTKAAEAERIAAEFHAAQVQVEAEAERAAAEKRAAAITALAKAKAEEEAVTGLSEVRVMEARANAIRMEGTAKAEVIQLQASAEATGFAAKANAEAQGLAAKANAEAEGIRNKAEAMKEYDSVGKDHEEFKLRLYKERDIELAQINIQRDIAEAQAKVLGEALKAAKVEIIGGDTAFFDRIAKSIAMGRSVDRFVANSQVASDIAESFIHANGNGDGATFPAKVRSLVDSFGLRSEDVKNLTISALIMRLMAKTDKAETKSMLRDLLDGAKEAGWDDKPATVLLGETSKR